MPSDAARRIINNRERATSTDMTRITDLAYRMTQEALMGAIDQDRTESGVLRGLTCTVDAGQREVTVSVGLALIRDDTFTHPDSEWRWLEATAPITVSLPASTGEQHWDVVEIAPGFVVTINTVVDVWDPTIPPNGAFAPENRDKEVQSTPTVTVRAGASNGSDFEPNFPTGVADVLPLCYVYEDAAGVVTGGTDGLVQCRPLLWPVGSMGSTDSYLQTDDAIEGRGWVQGGGINVTATGATINYAHTMGRFSNHRQSFTIGKAGALDIQANPKLGLWEGASIPGSDGPVYLYAFPVPYPSGYDALAAREFVVGSAVVSRFGCMSQTDDEQFNCGLVLSTQEPVTDTPITAQGFPNGNGTVGDLAFGTGTTRAIMSRASYIYIGAFDFDSSVDEAQEQSYKGGGLVALEGRVCGNNILALGVASTFHAFDIRVPDGTGGAALQAHIPESSAVHHCIIGYGATAPGVGNTDDNEINIRDAEVDKLFATTGLTKTLRHFTEGSASTFSIAGTPMRIVQSTTGANTSGQYISSNTTVFRCDVVAYEDAILVTR